MPAQYPNNLEAIFSSGSPSAIRFAMQQQANAENNDALEQQRQTLANQFSEQANPIKVQQEQENLNTTRAALPGVTANSSILGINAKKAEKTQESDIKATISKNLTQLSDDQVKQLGNMGQSMIHMAELVDGGQPVPIEMQQRLPPEILQALSTPEGRAKLKARGNQMMLDTGEHIRARELEQRRLDNAVKTTDMNNATSIRVAEIQAEARKAAAQKQAKDAYSAYQSAKTLEAQYTAATALSTNPELDEATRAHWNNIAETAWTNLQSNNTGKTTTGKVDITAATQGKVQVNPPPSRASNIKPSNGLTAPSGRTFTPN